MAELSLEDYGWDARFAASLAAIGDDGLLPGRVVMAGSGTFRLVVAGGERMATLAGKLHHAATSAVDMPTVGDWVAFREAPEDAGRIEYVLERRTQLVRKVPGKRSNEQVVAANVDTAIVVIGLDGDFNVRRMERFLATIRESGARPVVLLNKSDLCADPAARCAEAQAAAPGVRVLVASCTRGDGLEAVRAEVLPRRTAVLLGSSGVGKSTLINGLLGSEIQKTRDVREDDSRGRHTTTHRELFRLPGGGLLVDNPGIRELQLAGGSEQGLDQAFDDIAELAAGCRYGDCGHTSEPGCAVSAALADGSLAPGRLESYRSLQKELEFQALRQNEPAQRVQKGKWRAIHRELRRVGKQRKK